MQVLLDVLCVELHVAEGFRWDASLALPVSRYGATVRNLSVCDFTIAPHLTPIHRQCHIWHNGTMRIIQHTKQLLLHLRLFVLLLLCYKNTSTHAQVQTFFFFSATAPPVTTIWLFFNTLRTYTIVRAIYARPNWLNVEDCCLGC